jgi:hypothetical protein
VNSWDIADSFAGKVKPDRYQPWKVVPAGSKDNKTTNPTTTVVILPELFTEEDGPNVTTPPISPTVICLYVNVCFYDAHDQEYI